MPDAATDAGRQLWELLCSLPGIAVVRVDAQGSIVYANHEARLLYAGDARIDLTGGSIGDLEDERVARERLPLVKRCLSSGKPLIVRHIRGGRMLHALLWPMKTDCLLVLTREAPEYPRTHIPVFESDLADWGPLDVLSSRELEVLALVGQGMSVKHIAAQLQLAPKTVEKYRTAVGRKLGTASLADLVHMASKAGLAPEHAQKQRVHCCHGDKRIGVGQPAQPTAARDLRG